MYHQLSIWQEQKNPIVRMHNHLVTASFGYFELLSMRIFLLMISKLKWDDKDLLPIRINVSDILPSYKGGDHIDLVIKACDELKEKMKDIRILSINNRGKQVYERMTVIDNVKYVEDTDYIEAEFGRKIKPYLIDLKENFTQAELRELMTLKSSHAIRLYLLVKSLYRAGQVYTTTVNELKLMLLGSTEFYPEYKIFKRAVLKQAQSTLSKTSAAFEIEEERKGRSIEILHIKPLSYPKAIPIKTAISDTLKIILDDLKVNLSRICEMLQAGEISEEYVLFVIAAKQKDKKVKKPGGAIYDAVVNKQLWQDFQSSLTKGVDSGKKINISSQKALPSGLQQESLEYTAISYQEAEKMYQQQKQAGKTRFPIGGFIKGLKTSKNIVVEGYSY